MNSTALGTFCSDFPKYWVQQQQQTHHNHQPEKSANPKGHCLLLGLDTYQRIIPWTRENQGLARRCFSFGPKGFKGFPPSKWGFEVELWCGDGSKLTPLCGYSIISGFWFPAAKQTRPPGALTYPRLSLWTERAKFPTKPKIELISPVYLCTQASANFFLFWFCYHHNDLWHCILVLWKLKPNEVWWFDYILWRKPLTGNLHCQAQHSFSFLPSQ